MNAEIVIFENTKTIFDEENSELILNNLFSKLLQKLICDSTREAIFLGFRFNAINYNFGPIYRDKFNKTKT